MKDERMSVKGVSSFQETFLSGLVFYPLIQPEVVSSVNRESQTKGLSSTEMFWRRDGLKGRGGTGLYELDLIQPSIYRVEVGLLPIRGQWSQHTMI